MRQVLPPLVGQLVSLVEPGFGLEEKQIFEESGRPDLYDSAATVPAIYILQLRKHPSSTRLKKPVQSITGAVRLTGIRCALGPDAAAPASVSIVGKYVHSLRDRSPIHHRIDDKSEGCVDLSPGACAQDVKLNPERARGVLRRSRFGVDDCCGLLKSHTGEVIAVARGIAVGH